MNNEYFIEINFAQKIKDKEIATGDRFLTKRINDENRIISVLADGLGSGIKANVLSTLTASMAINFVYNYKTVKPLTEIIVKTLPICSVRKISYSTFTIIDIEDGKNVKLIEYDNPPTIIIKNNKIYEIERKKINFTHLKLGERVIKYAEFELNINDRIIFFTDGVIQSGIEKKEKPFGWGIEGVKEYINNIIKEEPEISSLEISNKIVSKAWANDDFAARDDISCASIYYRKPRKLLIITGPPYNKEKDKYIAYALVNYKGKKIICGGTTSNIIARELKREIKVDIKNITTDIPPVSYMEGVDLITEGIITLSKIAKILENEQPVFLVKNLNSKNPIDKIISLILDSDIIEFLVGTRINEAHQNPELPVELDIRRNIVKKIKYILESKFLKKVKVDYI